jgi:uncharacterized protein (TIGR00251 family)
MHSWYRRDERRDVIRLTVHVQPNAAMTKVAGLHGDALKVLVAAPAVDNKANAKLIGFLSEALGVAASRIVLKQGERGRRKIIEIGGATVAPETLLSGS